MNYITNTDRVSTEALSHGLTWGSHRYVRREGSPGNYRYIYPEDINRATPKPSPKPISSQASGAPSQQSVQPTPQSSNPLVRSIQSDIERGKKVLSALSGPLKTLFSDVQAVSSKIREHASTQSSGNPNHKGVPTFDTNAPKPKWRDVINVEVTPPKRQPQQRSGVRR